MLLHPSRPPLIMQALRLFSSWGPVGLQHRLQKVPFSSLTVLIVFHGILMIVLNIQLGSNRLQPNQTISALVKQKHVHLFHRDPFNCFENAELKRQNDINTWWWHLCTKHSSHTGSLEAGGEFQGPGRVSVGWHGKSECSSGGRVKQPLDHLLHFFWPVLVVLLRVLSEGDVCTSAGGEKM